MLFRDIHLPLVDCVGQGFVNETVAQKMAEIYRSRSEMPSVAKLIHATLLMHYDPGPDHPETKVVAF